MDRINLNGSTRIEVRLYLQIDKKTRWLLNLIKDASLREAEILATEKLKILTTTILLALVRLKSL
jgi:hypothetical protein